VRLGVEGYEQPEHRHRVNTPTMNAMNKLPKPPELKIRRDMDGIGVASLGGRKQGEDIELGETPIEYDNTGARIRLLV
jgi:hypothetical protein